MSGKSQDGFFKIRPTKRSNPEERTTLDVIHQHQLKKIQEEKEEVVILQEESKELKEQIESTTDDLLRGQLENQHVRLEEELAEKNKEGRLYDYLLDTGSLLFDYYDIQDKISKGAIGAISQRSKRKPGDVLSALETAAAIDTGIEQQTVKQERGARNKLESQTDEKGLSRDILLEKYLLKINPEYVKKSNDLDDMSGECVECGTDMMFSQNEAMLYCPECGMTEFILIDSDRPSYKDPPRESSYYAYKRINHFNELLAQFQAKGSTEIPQEIFDMITVELKKQRITDMKNLKYRQMREVLRKLKLNRQYDHIPYIISRLNGSIAPVMNRETEEKLRHMFKEIQPSFQKHCPKNRRNFLSYSYVLYKFCELLELDEFLASFPLLKNRDKLYQQSKVWQSICAEMGWEFIKSI
jgi:predicted  nucleic acid-binding Zn-ribbon protein